MFQQLFIQYNLSKEEVIKLESEFLFVALLHLIIAIESKLNEEDKKILQENLKNKNFQEIDNFLKNHFSEEELKNLIEEHVAPLLEDYIKNVLKS
jgi:hypothetical protein